MDKPVEPALECSLPPSVANEPSLHSCTAAFATSAVMKLLRFVSLTGLNSQVLASNNELVILPVNEPTFGTPRKSQIQTYLEQNEV